MDQPCDTVTGDRGLVELAILSLLGLKQVAILPTTGDFCFEREKERRVVSAAVRKDGSNVECVCGRDRESGCLLSSDVNDLTNVMSQN